MKRFLTSLWRVSRFPLLALAAGGLYLGAIQINDNFHTVVAGELYRSNQPNAGDLARYVERHGIRTVINLRGVRPDKPWYPIEVAEAKAAGVKLVDFHLSASRDVDTTRMQQLISVMRDAKKPLLIHCKAGADRSGLAAALYLAAVKKESVAIAERQLWPTYGHLPLPFLDAYAMDRSFDVFKPTLELAAQK